MNPDDGFNTIEEYQQEILNLRDQVTTVTAERDTAQAEVNRLTDENRRLGETNQRYFNRLMLEEEDQNKEDEEEDEPVLSCEDFAHTIII